MRPVIDEIKKQGIFSASRSSVGLALGIPPTRIDYYKKAFAVAVQEAVQTDLHRYYPLKNNRKRLPLSAFRVAAALKFLEIVESTGEIRSTQMQTVASSLGASRQYLMLAFRKEELIESMLDMARILGRDRVLALAFLQGRKIHGVSIEVKHGVL